MSCQSPTPSWTCRVWQEFHADNLTRDCRDVLLTLRTFRGPRGAAWPSHATLALRAKCCVRTVQRALAAARDLGLVVWSERRVRAGWRWLRSSNLYRFLRPERPVESLQRRPRATTGLQGRGGESEVKKAAHESSKAALAEMLRAAAAAPDLLKARREQFERQRIGARLGQRIAVGIMF
jgi:hypothetical protein